MAVQVAPVQKKEDPLGGMVMQMGSSILQEKLAGGMSPVSSKGGAIPATSENPAAAPAGAGIGELMKSQGPAASNPRDRRMNRSGGY